ncbi:ABC transporter substrate-binding protein [Micromonospora sp. BQ11]|uniref:ABC transporter substrate-binding protein n=1 Tax=Micromonospora sp. BQ11 TaxID=3452212 RepID=UPI003F8A0270
MRTPLLRRGMWAAVAATVVALASGCSGLDRDPDGTPAASASAGAAFPVTVTDAAGTAHTFAKPVERIACYWYGCNSMLADLGLLPVLTWKDESLRSKVFLGEGYSQVRTVENFKNPEEVAQAEPELIIGRTPRSDDFDALKAAGTTFYMDGGFDKGIAVYEQNLRWLGAITGRTAQAEQAIGRFASVLNTVKGKAPADAKETSFAVLSGYDTAKYAVFFDNVIFCQLIEANGLGDCVLTAPAGVKVEDAYGEVGAEYLLKTNPDYIANQYDGTPATSISQRKDAVWPKIPAVQQGRAFDTEAQFYCCSVRELQYALETYAHKVFPGAGFVDPGRMRDYDPAAGGVNRQ